MMFKKFLFLMILFCLIIQPAWAVTQWTASGVPASTSESASNFPAEIYAQWAILQTLLQNYRNGYHLQYDNATTLTITSGEVSVWNGTASLFLQNTGAQMATSANLDTGASFLASSTYYVYAGSSSTTQATATISISLNNTTPSNLTYYKQLGSFTTDGSANINEIIDNGVYSKVGASVSKATGTPYQATTDGVFSADCSMSTGASCQLYTNSTNPPSVLKQNCGALSGTFSASCPMSELVRKGDYYECIATGTTCTDIFFTPQGQ